MWYGWVEQFSEHVLGTKLCALRHTNLPYICRVKKVFIGRKRIRSEDSRENDQVIRDRQTRYHNQNCNYVRNSAGGRFGCRINDKPAYNIAVYSIGPRTFQLLEKNQEEQLENLFLTNCKLYGDESGYYLAPLTSNLVVKTHEREKSFRIAIAIILPPLICEESLGRYALNRD